MNSNLVRVVGLVNVMSEIRLTGGISYNLNTGQINPREGYMVSLANFEEIVSVVDEETVKDYISRHATEFAKENVFFGCWFDGTNFVFDVSEHYERKRDAIFWAIIRKQKAIWDCAAKKECRFGKRNLKTIINQHIDNLSDESEFKPEH